MRTLRITGKGNVRARPDTTRITMTLTGMLPEYGDALKKSSEDTELLRELLKGFGFRKTDLKTLSFDIDTEYESYKDRGVYKEKLVGYSWRHLMKVEFDSDNIRLGKILAALAGSRAKPEFRISYTVKDPEAVKNELLEKAVADARKKAEVLADAACLTLGSIQTVDYSWGKVDLEIAPMNRMVKMSEIEAAGNEDTFAMNIEPDDIEMSDTVTVVWEIT